jgi:hypothetical protein
MTAIFIAVNSRFYFNEAQKRWMRWQASSKASVEVA